LVADLRCRRKRQGGGAVQFAQPTGRGVQSYGLRREAAEQALEAIDDQVSELRQGGFGAPGYRDGDEEEAHDRH
jgi:hypothetical protein